jgi:hypothetical protein
LTRPLRDERDGLDFDDARVVRRDLTKEVRGNRCAISATNIPLRLQHVYVTNDDVKDELPTFVLAKNTP